MSDHEILSKYPILKSLKLSYAIKRELSTDKTFSVITIATNSGTFDIQTDQNKIKNKNPSSKQSTTLRYRVGTCKYSDQVGYYI